MVEQTQIAAARYTRHRLAVIVETCLQLPQHFHINPNLTWCIINADGASAPEYQRKTQLQGLFWFFCIHHPPLARRRPRKLSSSAQHLPSCQRKWIHSEAWIACIKLDKRVWISPTMRQHCGKGTVILHIARWYIPNYSSITIALNKSLTSINRK